MEVTARFKALHYKEENVGKLISFSKRKFVWEFEMNGKQCVLTLKVSKITDNYSVELNKQLLYKGNKSYDHNFEFKFKIEGIALSIKKHNANFVLYIQHVPFKDFYEGDKGRQTRLVKPELVLDPTDFDKPQPEKRFKSMNVKPLKPHVIEALLNNSTPMGLPNRGVDYPEVNKIEEWKKNKKKDDERFLKVKNAVVSTHCVEDSTNPFEDEESIRGRKKTFQFGAHEDTHGLDICPEEDSDGEADDKTDEAGESPMKESMDVLIFPCDFDDRNIQTEQVIKVLYSK